MQPEDIKTTYINSVKNFQFALLNILPQWSLLKQPTQKPHPNLWQLVRAIGVVACTYSLESSSSVLEDPVVDSTVLSLKTQFIKETGAQVALKPRLKEWLERGGTLFSVDTEKLFQDTVQLQKTLSDLEKKDQITSVDRTALEAEESYPFELRGDQMGIYGLSEVGSSSFKSGHTSSTLLMRTPEPGYLHRQGIYHGYRLLFGNGYIVPSMMVQFKNTTTQDHWTVEVLPFVQNISSLKDLREPSHQYSLGVQLIGSFMFPSASLSPESFKASADRLLVLKELTFQDRLESSLDASSEGVSPLSGPAPFPLSKDFRTQTLPEELKQHLKRTSVVSFLPRWLYALTETEERVHQMDLMEESLRLKLSTLHTLGTTLQKIQGLSQLSYKLKGGDVETLLSSGSQASVLSKSSSLPLPAKSYPLKEITLLTLYEYFFKNTSQDWTEVFEVMGETFPTYGPYFTHQSHRLKDITLLKTSLQKNRKPAVLKFMLHSGLKAEDLSDVFHEVVKNAGQRLEIERAISWIKALAEEGVFLEHKDPQGYTALDLALEQNKHKIAEALIEAGAGANVKPHLVIDYMNRLKEDKPLHKRASFAGRESSVARKEEETSSSIFQRQLSKKEESFHRHLDLLEFRNHQLRWQLTLESLFPLSIGSQEGMKVKTTEGERLLTLPHVSQLWKGGKPKEKNFLSFTKTTDIDQKKYGRRTVGKITDGRYTLYIKQYPELPGIEEAVGTLTRQLLGYGAPNTLLANIQGTAYLFSEGINGRPLQDYLTNQADHPWDLINSQLDPEPLSGMILLAMLTNPEDGKPDNYMVQPRPNQTYQLIGIDNDHAFVPSASTVQGKKKMNVKSILFALNQMNDPLHSHLKRKFLYYNPRGVLEEWIHRLKQRAGEYESLFSQKEIVKHFSDHESFLGIALHPSIVVDLYKNLVSLQQLIESEESLTHMDILRKFHRPIYLRYQEGHEQHPELDPLERFKFIDGKEYKISKKKELQTLSTGMNLLSTNMMITTKKDLFDYVKKGRGGEVRLDEAMATLQEIADQDSRLLAQQAMAQAGTTTPFEKMTDPQRESFLKELEWSRLPIANQQALLEEIARVSWGDATQNLGPWRGNLIFRNCKGFTQERVFTNGFEQKMNWNNIHEVRIIVDEKGGKEALINVGKALNKLSVPLKIQAETIDMTDEELDEAVKGENVTQLILKNCRGLQDAELRQKAPNLVWKEWLGLSEKARASIRDVVMNDKEELKVDDIRVVGAKTLAKVLKNTKLSELNLFHSEIGDEGIEALAKKLKDIQVENLDLSYNQIGPEGAKALAVVLKDTQIQELHLSCNRVQLKGAAALAKGMKESKVKTLNIQTAGIHAAEAEAFAKELRNNMQLKELDMSGNKIGSRGLVALAKILKYTQIKMLYLSGGQIGNSGIEALAKVLKDTQILSLNLVSNNIGDVGAVALAAGLKDSKVSWLNLSYNQIGEVLLQQIEEILIENRRKNGRKNKISNSEKNQTEEHTSYRKNASGFHHPELSLEDLLLEAGMKGDGEQKVYATAVEKAADMLTQKQEHLYPHILKILTDALSQNHRKMSKGRERLLEDEEDIEFEDADFGRSPLPSSSFNLSLSEEDRERGLKLLKELSAVYPQASLSLAALYQERGDMDNIVETLMQSLQSQLPGTLEKIQGFYKSYRHPSYALLLAENALQGYMSPVNLDQGEHWIREFLKADDDNPEVLTKLAYVLIEKGGLEDQKVYKEIDQLLTKAKSHHYGEAMSLALMIETLQHNRKVTDVPLSEKTQHYNARQQRLLRALHQSQFQQPSFEPKDLSADQVRQLAQEGEKYEIDKENLTTQLESAEEDLGTASPLDKRAIEAEILQLRLDLQQTQEKYHYRMKGVLFPEGIRTASTVKQFYEEMRRSLRQQFSLLDAIEGGLTKRQEDLMEMEYKRAIAVGMGRAGEIILSNAPIPASGIISMITSKAVELAADKVTGLLQDRVTDSHDDKAAGQRGNAKQITQGFEQNTVVANGLAALYTYRLQNLLPYLTEKSIKDLSARLSASVMSYLQDKKRITNPNNLTQLSVMGFYHNKGMTLGDLVEKSKGKHGLKKTDGKMLSYGEIFAVPLIETTDGAQYQVSNRHTRKETKTSESLLHMVPLIERDIIQNQKLQEKQQAELQEKRLPQMSPFQVEIIKDQDDTDYARKAMEFVASLPERE